MTVKDDRAYLAGFEDGCATMADAVAALRRELLQWRFVSVTLGMVIACISYVLIGGWLWKLSRTYAPSLSS